MRWHCIRKHLAPWGQYERRTHASPRGASPPRTTRVPPGGWHEHTWPGTSSHHLVLVGTSNVRPPPRGVPGAVGRETDSGITGLELAACLCSHPRATAPNPAPRLRILELTTTLRRDEGSAPTVRVVNWPGAATAPRNRRASQGRIVLHSASDGTRVRPLEVSPGRTHKRSSRHVDAWRLHKRLGTS